MSGVPRGVAAPVPVVVADLRATFAVFRTRPVTAGMVAFLPRKVGCAVVLGTCEDVVSIWLVTAPVDHVAVFIQRCAFDDVGAQVQLVEVVGDQIAACVIPGAFADPVARGFTVGFAVG